MHFTADHAQQAIRRVNLVLLSSTSQKISTGKIWPKWLPKQQNGPGLWEFAGESGSDSKKLLTEAFATSVYKQLKRQLSLPATSTHTREL